MTQMRKQNQFFSNRDILDKIAQMNFAEADRLQEFLKIDYNVLELLEVLMARGFVTEQHIIALAKEMSGGSLDIITTIDGLHYETADLYLKGLTRELFYEMISPEFQLNRLYSLAYHIDHENKKIYIVTPIYPVQEIADGIKNFKLNSKIVNSTHTITLLSDEGNNYIEERTLVDYSFVVQLAPLKFMQNLLAANAQVDTVVNKTSKAIRERAIKSGFGDNFQDEIYKTFSGTLSSMGQNAESQALKIILDGMNGFNDVRASDIHIEPTLGDGTGGYIRYRINGGLTKPLYLEGINDILQTIKTWAALPTDITGTKQDGAFNIKFNEEKFSFRISFMPIGEKDKKKQKLVMRELTDDVSRLDLKKNKMDARFVNILENLLGAPKDGKLGKYKDGLFLMTGPTGSGKSTTMMSILNSLNTYDVNIVTLEDPIEYKIPGINQSQIFHPEGKLLEGENENSLYSFQQGIEASLRQDPDIIFIGEIRNPTTMNATKVAAMTGHVVLSTLHTNNTFETLERIVGLGIDVDTISSFVRLIMAQRLAGQVCPSCKKEYNDPIFSETTREQAARDLEYLKRKLEIYAALADSEYIIDLPSRIEDLKLYKGAGCSKCNYTGLGKRVGIYEFLEVTLALQDFLSNKEKGGVKAGKKDIREFFIKNNVVTLYQNAMYKVATGVSYPEIKDADGNPTVMYLDFDSAISAAGGDIYGYQEQYKGFTLLDMEDIILTRKKERELEKYKQDFLQAKNEYDGLIKFVGLTKDNPIIKTLLAELHRLQGLIKPLQSELKELETKRLSKKDS